MKRPFRIRVVQRVQLAIPGGYVRTTNSWRLAAPSYVGAGGRVVRERDCRFTYNEAVRRAGQLQTMASRNPIQPGIIGLHYLVEKA